MWKVRPPVSSTPGVRIEWGGAGNLSCSPGTLIYIHSGLRTPPRALLPPLLLLLFIYLFMATPEAYGSAQARGQLLA